MSDNWRLNTSEASNDGPVRPFGVQHFLLTTNYDVPFAHSSAGERRTGASGTWKETLAPPMGEILFRINDGQ